MTVSRIIYVVLVLVLIAFFVLYVDRLSLILLVFIILLPILSLAMCIVARKSLTFRFDVKSKTISKDSPLKLDITINNGSYVPISNVVLMFRYSNSLDGIVHKMSISIPSAPKSSNTVSFNLTSKYCGIVNVKLFETKVYDNLRMFCLKKRHQQECSMLIMPRIHDIPLVVENVANTTIESDVFSKTRSGDDCSEVFDIREYQDGDRLNRVHWKLSSKGNETYVKEYSLPITNSIVIIPEVVNCKGEDNISTMDTVIELLLSLSQALNCNEVHHKICLYHENDCSIEDISNGEESYTAIGRMVRNGMPNVSEPYAFKYFQAIDESNVYSHTIYITNVLNVSVLSSLEDFNSVRKTVFFVSNSRVPSAFLNYDGIQIVQVVKDRIPECVNEFIV